MGLTGYVSSESFDVMRDWVAYAGAKPLLLQPAPVRVLFCLITLGLSVCNPAVVGIGKGHIVKRLTRDGQSVMAGAWRTKHSISHFKCT
jgi:hypothetical protein